MATRRFAYGVSVLGFAITHESHGYPIEVRFSTVNRSLENEDRVDRIYVDALCGEDGGGAALMPDVRSVRVEPFEGSGQFGGMTARIQIDKHGMQFKGKSPTQNLADFLMGSKPKPWGRVWYSALDSYIEDINFDPHSTLGVGEIDIQRYRNRAHLAAGDIIYWGREALQVVSYLPNDRGSPPSLAFKEVTARVFLRRGVGGSAQETHKLGDYDDVEIYTRNNVLKGRDARVYRLDLDTNEETLIWEGILDEPSSRDSFGFIELNGRGSIAWSEELSVGWKRAYWSFDSSQRDTTSGAIKSVHVRNSPITPLESPGGADMVVIRGNAVQPVKLAFTRDRSGGLYRYEVTGTFSPIMGTYSDRKKEEETDAQAPPMKEVLVGDKRYTFFYRPDEQVYLLHPFDVIRCLLCSTGTRKAGENEGKNGYYDVLPPGWGLGFPSSRIDHDAIDALKSEPSDTSRGGPWYLGGLEMTNLLIGNKDETFKQVFERILKPLMCFFTINQDSKITIGHMADPGPDGVVASYTPLDFTKIPTQTGMAYEPRTDIRYTISRRGASGEYSGEIVATNVRRSEGASYRNIATDEEIDAQDYGDPSVTSGSFEDTPSGQALQALSSLRFGLANTGFQSWEFGIQEHDLLLVPGTCINISYPALFNPADGGRGVSETRCLVVEQSVDPGTFNQSLGLINIGHGLEDVLNLAPAWRVSARTSDSSFTLTASDPLSSPRSAMEVGMRVTVCSPDGEKLQGSYGHRLVSAYNPGTGVVTLASAFSATLSIGQYIILSNYPTVEPTDLPNLKYCYLSDIEGELTDTLSVKVAGHTWGQ